MDTALKVGLWNVVYEHRLQSLKRLGFQAPEENRLVRELCTHYLHVQLGALPDHHGVAMDLLCRGFMKLPWNEVYDVVEFAVQDYYGDSLEEFRADINSVLQRHGSAYRLVGGEMLEAMTDIEIEAVETALDRSCPLAGVHAHLQTALRLLSDRESPDYRNSIKESISAVEGMGRLITGDDKTTLGAALKPIEEKVGIHGALKAAFSKLYGYTSDEDGVRHGMAEESAVGAGEARYMLVACSAFVSYLVDKAGEAGLELQGSE